MSRATARKVLEKMFVSYRGTVEKYEDLLTNRIVELWIAPSLVPNSVETQNVRECLVTQEVLIFSKS